MSGLAQSSPGPLVVLGAGNSGPWITEFVLANPSNDPVVTAISVGPQPETVCPGDCLNTRFVAVQRNGASTALAPPAGFPLLFVSATTGTTPAVRARIYNSEAPAQAADLPVFSLATLLALKPDVLVFGIRPQASHTNLQVANLQGVGQRVGSDVTLRVEAFSAAGQELASKELTLPFGQSVYIVNIAQYLGIANPAAGQIRVTRVGGAGVFWGILPSLNADGTISITLGAAP